VLAYLGSDLDAEKHDDPQGYSFVGLVTLPVTVARLHGGVHHLAWGCQQAGVFR